MTNEAILQKSIEKAIKNGYSDSLWFTGDMTKFSFVQGDEHSFQISTEEGESWISVSDIIFSHDFAKAFFKDLEWEWTHYLQQMVLEENRLKYLEKFL